MTEKELFISWLNDAYSTELAMMPVLENHANDARDYPQIHNRQMRHFEETKRQAEQVKTMIESLGGKVSTAKSILGKTLGLGKSVSTGMFQDELIKNFLGDYAAEHLEIASYKSLIATAKHLGEQQCVPILEKILAEEESMAAWLKEHIPMATVESIKITASDNGKGSKKSGKAKSAAAGVFTPTGMVTLLGIGAVAAGATMFWRSRQNNTDSDGAGTLNVKSGDGVDKSHITKIDDADQTDILSIETLIVTDESKPLSARTGETF